MLSKQYLDGWRARMHGENYRPKASEDWRMGWNDADIEETTPEQDMLSHYEDDF